MFCRFCGKPNDDKNSFCQTCGQSLTTQDSPKAYCHGCGKKLETGAIFCRLCGQKVLPSSQQAGKVKTHSRWDGFTKGRKIGLVLITVLVFLLGLMGISDLFNDGSYGSTTVRPPEKVAIFNTGEWGNVPINEICLMLKEGSGKSEADGIAKSVNGKVVGEIAYINTYLIELPAKSEGELKQALLKVLENNKVYAASPNLQVKTSVVVQGTPCSPLDDPRYAGANGANYRMIGMENAWRIIQASGVSTKAVNVGVVDNGVLETRNEFTKKGKIQYTHTDAKLTQPLSFYDANAKGYYQETSDSHGTAVARIIGANPEDGGLMGIASVMGDKMTITSTNWAAPPYNGGWAQVKKDPKDPTQKEFANGTWAFSGLNAVHATVKSGATIVNCSFGPAKAGITNSNISKIYRAYFEKMAKEHPEVLFVCSAGNAGVVPGQDERWPGGMNLPNVVTVGSIETNGQQSSYSNKVGPHHEVTLCAPGSNVVNGYNTADGSLSRQSGTSFSTPQVAAAAALMRSLNPNLKAEDIKKILVETAVTQTAVDGKNVTIPQAVGGRLLAIDRAVLKVINDQRGANKMPLLTLEQALALGKIELIAEGGGRDWKVTATVDSIPGNGTELLYSMQAPGSLGGAEKERINQAGSVVRTVSIFESTGVLKVKRLDNGLCWKVMLKQFDLSGTWSGQTYIETYQASAGIVANTSRRDPISFVFKEAGSGQYEGTYLFGGLNFPVSVKVDGDNITIGFNAQRDDHAAHFTWTGNMDGEVIKATGNGRETIGKNYIDMVTKIELRKTQK